MKLILLVNHTMLNKWPYMYTNGRMHTISHADNETWTSDITIQQTHTTMKYVFLNLCSHS